MLPQIRLSRKQSKKRHTPITSAPQPVCSACRAQFSRYTCPTCNFHYCSLVCFRSPTHASCSESFDRRTLVDDIRSAEGKTESEKVAMMAMLQRFEAQSHASAEQDDFALSGDDERTIEAQELAAKLHGVDLDSLAPDELLGYLSPSQRADFEATLLDPAKADVLLSTSSDFHSPWWATDSDSEDGEDSDRDAHPTRHRTGGPEPLASRLHPIVPSPNELPSIKIDADGCPIVNNDLVHNIFALLLVYALIVRKLSVSNLASIPAGSDNHRAALDMFKDLSPFLVTKSSAVFGSVGEAISAVLTDESSRMTPLDSAERGALLCSDVAQLIIPLPVIAFDVGKSSTDASPHSNSLAALRDLMALFESAASSVKHVAKNSDRGSKPQAVVQKVRFYCAIIAHPASPWVDLLPGLVRDVKIQGQEFAQAVSKGQLLLDSVLEVGTTQKLGVPNIQELD